MRLERALEDVERFAIGAVADRVHAQLVAMLNRETRRLVDFRDRRRLEPGAFRFVGVRFQQPGSPRAERAIDLLLDRAHGQVPVGVIDHSVLGELRRDDCVRLPHHDPQAHPQLSLVDHLLDAIDR